MVINMSYSTRHPSLTVKNDVCIATRREQQVQEETMLAKK